MKRKQISWAFTLLILVLAMSLNPEQVAANNNTPIAVINLPGNSTTVSPGIPITFDGTQSFDPDNTNIIAYNWWYVDGVVKSQGSTADKKMFSYNFTLPAGVNSKTYQIKLTVRDNEYTTASKTITVTVHNGSAQTEYYLTDHLGSIRTTIDQNGTVIGFDDYDPFGNVLPGRSLNLGTPNDLNKFTGHERDQEGGLDLDYMLARNYDSELGRFYSVDPLATGAPGITPYRYAFNNPMRYIDPDGRFELDAAAIKKYPRLAYYLKNNIQGITSNSTILAGLAKFGQLTVNTVSNAVKWGQGPRIVPRNLSSLSANGAFEPGKGSNVIYIDEDILQNLEKALASGSEAALLLVTSTILHEFTHFGDDQDGKDYPGEEGELFEIFTYGIDIDNLNDAKKVLKDYKDRQKKEAQKKSKSLNNLLDDLDNLEVGTYTWNGSDWVKEN